MANVAVNLNTPWCCYTCSLQAYGFEDAVIRRLVNTEFDVEDFVGFEEEGMDQLREGLSDLKVDVLKALAAYLLEFHHPGNAFICHKRYYQREIIKTEIIGLDNHFPEEGFCRGRVYVLYEPLRSFHNSGRVFGSILRSSQRRIEQDGIVPGIDDAIHDALLITTEDANPGYLEPMPEGLIHVHVPSTVDQATGFLSVEDDHLWQAFLEIPVGHDPGLICIDHVLANTDGMVLEDNEPRVSFWVDALVQKFGSLDDIVVVVLVDESQFNRARTHEERLVYSLRYNETLHPITTIVMNSDNPETWPVVQGYLEAATNSDDSDS